MRKIAFSTAGKKLYVNVDGVIVRGVEIDFQTVATSKQNTGRLYHNELKKTVLKQLQSKLVNNEPYLKPDELKIVIDRVSNAFDAA